MSVASRLKILVLAMRWIIFWRGLGMHRCSSRRMRHRVCKHDWKWNTLQQFYGSIAPMTISLRTLNIGDYLKRHYVISLNFVILQQYHRVVSNSWCTVTSHEAPHTFIHTSALLICTNVLAFAVVVIENNRQTIWSSVRCAQQTESRPSSKCPAYGLRRIAGCRHGSDGARMHLIVFSPVFSVQNLWNKSETLFIILSSNQHLRYAKDLARRRGSTLFQFCFDRIIGK